MGELCSTPNHQPSGSLGSKMGIVEVRAVRERQEQQEGGGVCSPVQGKVDILVLRAEKLLEPIM